MRIPLLVGACPRFVTATPKVRLPKGNWRLTADGLKDSSISICCESTSSDSSNFDINGIVKGPNIIQVVFGTKGSETNLSIYANLIEETANVA